MAKTESTFKKIPRRTLDAIEAFYDIPSNRLSILKSVFPAGRVEGHEFVIGDFNGSKGKSLKVHLNGKGQVFQDFATNEGGCGMISLIQKHQGCSFPEAVKFAADFAGVTIEELPAKPAPKKSPAPPASHYEFGKPDLIHDFTDTEGRTILLVHRYPNKEIRPWHFDGKKWVCKRPKGLLPLYRLTSLAMETDKPVLVVEGEKTADAGAEIIPDYTVTTWHGGTGNLASVDLSPLAGRRIVLWPDADEPGQKAMDQLAQAALAAGAIEVSMVEVPTDAPDGWDLADMLPDGWDMEAMLADAEPVAPPELKGFGEDGLALEFSHRHADDWRHCGEWGKWLQFDDGVWRTEQTHKIFDLIRVVCRDEAHLAEKPSDAEKVSRGAVNYSVEKLARSDRRHAVTADAFDADDWILNTPTGTVDLKTGFLRPHDRLDYCTRSTVKGPDGECKRWLKFISEITGKDDDLAGFIQRMAGYCLTGSTNEHAIFFLFGLGANGKSVFTSTLAGLMGDYAITAPMSTFLASRNEQHPTDLASLRAARLVTSTETQQGRSWDEARLKALTGGDKISARFMRQNFFEFTPKFKLLISGNHRPTIKSVDEAMRRRLHLVPFVVTIPPSKRDADLTDKLQSEWPGILNWALAGLKAYHRDGLNPPAAVIDATADYLTVEDSFGTWLEECCDLDAPGVVASADLWASWKSWAERNGEHIGNRKQFSQTLVDRTGIQPAWADGGSKRGFSGIQLKPDTELF